MALTSSLREENYNIDFFHLYNNSGFSGLYYKQVTIVIFDRNDSGQYHKTTIMIVIDDPSLS